MTYYDRFHVHEAPEWEETFRRHCEAVLDRHRVELEAAGVPRAYFTEEQADLREQYRVQVARVGRRKARVPEGLIVLLDAFWDDYEAATAQAKAVRKVQQGMWVARQAARAEINGRAG